jgi:glycerol-3-phosphate acyltransferase PlsY
LRSGKRGGERCRAVGRFFVFIRHKENIQRLLVGAEPRIGKKG